MDGAAVDSERGFLHRLVQRRVPVAGARDILRRGTKGHRGRTFMDDRAGFMSDNVDAKNTIRFRVSENLYETVGMALGPRAAVRGKREASLAIGDSSRLQRVLALAEGRHFWRRIDNSRNKIVIDMTSMTGHHFDGGDAVLLGLVGQHRPVNHIADGVDILDRRLEPGINLDPATLGHGNARILEPETIDDAIRLLEELKGQSK